MDAGWHIFLVTLVIKTCHASHVEYKVTDLTKEVALVDVPLATVTTRDVKVVVKERNTGEVGGPFDDWLAIRVSDELSVVILDDGTRNAVSARWEIHDSSQRRCRAAIQATSQLT